MSRKGPRLSCISELGVSLLRSHLGLGRGRVSSSAAARLHAANPSAHERLALARGHPAGLLLREMRPRRTPHPTPLRYLPTAHQKQRAKSVASRARFGDGARCFGLRRYAGQTRAESFARTSDTVEGGEGILAGDVQGRARGDPRLSGAKERSWGLRPAPVVAEEDTSHRPKQRCKSKRGSRKLDRPSVEPFHHTRRVVALKTREENGGVALDHDHAPVHVAHELLRDRVIEKREERIEIPGDIQ